MTPRRPSRRSRDPEGKLGPPHPPSPVTARTCPSDQPGHAPGRSEVALSNTAAAIRVVTCGGAPVSVRWRGMAHAHPLMYLDSYVTILVH
jgi:hypothetical protein